MTNNISRQPAGQPSGGQFSEGTRGASGVNLGGPTGLSEDDLRRVEELRLPIRADDVARVQDKGDNVEFTMKNGDAIISHTNPKPWLTVNNRALRDAGHSRETYASEGENKGDVWGSHVATGHFYEATGISPDSGFVFDFEGAGRVQVRPQPGHEIGGVTPEPVVFRFGRVGGIEGGTVRSFWLAEENIETAEARAIMDWVGENLNGDDARDGLSKSLSNASETGQKAAPRGRPAAARTADRQAPYKQVHSPGGGISGKDLALYESLNMPFDAEEVDWIERTPRGFTVHRKNGSAITKSFG